VPLDIHVPDVKPTLESPQHINKSSKVRRPRRLAKDDGGWGDLKNNPDRNPK